VPVKALLEGHEVSIVDGGGRGKGIGLGKRAGYSGWAVAQKTAKPDKSGRLNQPFAALEALKAKVPPPEPSLVARAANAKLAPAPSPATGKQTAREEDLFLEEMAGTQPLDRRIGRVGAPPAAAPVKSKRSSDDAEVLATLADLIDGTGSFDISDSDEYIEGVAAGIDRRLLKQLRSGAFSVQAHIDLHGLTRDEAHSRVARFFVESRKAGRRCVLVVHGRGLHSKDQIPVLKQAVKTWLERGQTGRAVLAFATARPSDGGAGAVYVLLRR
jgi:DNA-nicking Smr family endonuclease